nr:immunoglobulin heavy chain junction region [Mus musculus]
CVRRDYYGSSPLVDW